jgi:hypothetical protein
MYLLSYWNTFLYILNCTVAQLIGGQFNFRRGFHKLAPVQIGQLGMER